MVRPKKGVVFLSCVFSIVAVLLSLTSLCTEAWVVAKGEVTAPGFENQQLSTIGYGLFTGTIFLYHTRTNYEITMTCVLNENICAYLCKATADARELELRHLYNGQPVYFDMSCPQILRTNPVRSKFAKPQGLTIRYGHQREFLNAGLYVATVFFLSVSIIFGLLSVVLLFWNTVSDPAGACFNIYGLYVYIAIASSALLSAVVLWGIHFGVVIVNNVGILFTIQGEMDTRGLAELGYSYWLLLPSFLFYMTSLSLLYIRQYLVTQDPKKIHGSIERRETVTRML